MIFFCSLYRMFPGWMDKYTYEEMLSKLYLTTLDTRRLRAVILDEFEILNQHDVVNPEDLISSTTTQILHGDTNTNSCTKMPFSIPTMIVFIINYTCTLFLFVLILWYIIYRTLLIFASMCMYKHGHIEKQCFTECIYPV